MLIDPIPSWENYYMSLAYLVSCRSADPNTKVGAILAFPNKSFISGFNGCPSGVDNALLMTDDKHPVVRHAEANCLAFAGIDKCQQFRPTLFVMFRPCYRCLGELIHFRIPKIIYHTEYRSTVNDDRLSKLLLDSTPESIRPSIIKYDEAKWGKLLFSHGHMGALTGKSK